MTRRLRLATLLSVLALPPAALAQRTSPARPTAATARVPQMSRVDTALLRGMKYRFVGHTRGGRVTAVTGVPSQPRTFYMGVASGGVFRTTNAGTSWEPITDG